MVDIPESPVDSFFGGQVYVCNKNKITLQNVSLERKAMDEDFEKVMAGMKNVKAVRSQFESCPEVKQKVYDFLSVFSVVDLNKRNSRVDISR